MDSLNLMAVTWGPRTFSARTTDGSLIDYTVDFPSITSQSKSSAVVRYPNGTVVDYTAPSELVNANELYPTRITDANGNYISITYRNGSGPAIDTITDTLGRMVSFHYDANNALTAISGPSLNGGTRVLIRLHYGSGSKVGYGFGGRIDAIFYPANNTGYWFGDTDSYSVNGILKNVRQRRAMNLTAASLTEQGTVVSSGMMTRERTYGYPGSAAGRRIAVPTDMPTYTRMTESWSDMDSAKASTTYAITGQRTQITYPDGGRYVLTTDNKGLESQTELYNASNKLMRKSTLAWETGAHGSPRVKRVETTDELNQVTAQEFSYGPTENQLVETRDYDYGGTNLLRKVHTDYLGRDRNVTHACFRPITSSVSVVSDFVANGYQTMQHVSTSPPAIPDSQISRVRF